MKSICTIDFETYGIQSRHITDDKKMAYPPMPTGVSIKFGDEPSEYLSWGHPSENNSTFTDAKKILQGIWKNYEVVMHNAKFDLEVNAKHFDLPLTPAHGFHCTMVLAFLNNPHEPKLNLKVLADKHLDMPPEEEAELKEWLCENQEILHKTYPDDFITASGNIAFKKYNWKGWGKYYAHAPGDIVGKYAEGDTDRTKGLFDIFYENIRRNGMLKAYKTEIKLIPIMIRNEQRGVRVDLALIEKMIANCKTGIKRCEAWLSEKSGITVDMNKAELIADALEIAGFVNHDDWIKTATGKRSTSKVNLPEAIKRADIKDFVLYERQLKFNLGILETWYEQAKVDGKIFFQWHSVKGSAYGSDQGAKTGRFSTTPNMQYVPKKPAKIFFDTLAYKEAKLAGESGFLLPKELKKKLPQIPKLRKCILPYEENHVIIDKDYKQQEPRILAHLEQGDLLIAYLENPLMDIYNQIKTKVELIYTEKKYSRSVYKMVLLAIMYGMGLKTMAARMGISIAEAEKIKSLVLLALPGLKDVDDKIKKDAAMNIPVATFNGRQYTVEEPGFDSKGVWRTYEYKMLNHIIQGSAADCTKIALVRYAKWSGNQGLYIYLTVHDEIVLSCPVDEAKRHLAILTRAMESVKFDVDMLTDTEYSAKSWGDLKPLKRKAA